MSELLTIGEVSKRSGVASSALRFYERARPDHVRAREGGQRRYPRHVLRRIAFIVFAQRVGLTLDEIGAELAKLDPNRAPGRARLVAAHRHAGSQRIDERIAELAAPARRARRMHRLRLPVARPLPAHEPGRSRRPGRAGAPLLARRPRGLTDRVPRGHEVAVPRRLLEAKLEPPRQDRSALRRG